MINALINKPVKWLSLRSLLRFLLVIKVSQSKHKHPFSKPSSHTCGCPAKNSGLTPNKFFKFHVEQTDVDPEYRAIMIAWNKKYICIKNIVLFYKSNVRNCKDDRWKRLKCNTWSDHQPISIGWNSVKPGGNFLDFGPIGLTILYSGCSDNFHFFCNNKFGKFHSETEPSVCKHAKNSPLGEIFIKNMIDPGWKLKTGTKFHTENRDLLVAESSNVNDNLQCG